MRIAATILALVLGLFMPSDIVAWASASVWIYSPGTPFTGVDGTFIYITGGTGWTPGFYYVVGHVTAFDTGTADGSQNMLQLDRAPAAAATRNGVGIYQNGTPPTLTQVIVCDGNSLTAGTGPFAVAPYPAQLLLLIQAAAAANYPTGSNVGVPSQTTADMNTDAVAQVDALYNAGAIKNICIAWEGTNSIYFGASAAAAKTGMETYCSGRKAAGFTVCVMTFLPRSGGGEPGDFETSRATYNGALRADFNVATAKARVFKPAGGVTYADYLIDVAANGLIGDSGDELNTTYYHTDKVHMNTAGYNQIALDGKDAFDLITAVSSGHKIFGLAGATKVMGVASAAKVCGVA